MSVWPRRALLATNLAMGITLVALAWSNARASRAASELLARGHAELLAQSIQRSLREGPPDEEQLTALLQAGAADGLRYLAVYGPRADRPVSVGSPLADPQPEVQRFAGGDSALQRRGAYFRYLLRLPPPRGAPPPPPPPRQDARERRPAVGDLGQPGDGSPPPPPPPRGERPPPRDGGGGRRPQSLHGGGVLLIDFESVAVLDLEQRARWSLRLGISSALLLTGLAVLLWRQALERERSQAAAAQQRRLSSLGEMAAVLAHEIRNPLASLKGNAEVLAELAASPSPSPESLARKAGWLVREAARLSSLLDDLLDFARSGPLELAATPVASLLEAAAGEVDAGRVRLDLAAAPASWSLDGVRLRQVLVNLVRNALEASPPGQPVELAAVAHGGKLVISVRDHGDGLPPGAAEQIFEPFFTTRARGTGLGLAVARRIVESHGGRLEARNHPEGGAELRIVLPATSPARPATG